MVRDQDFWNFRFQNQILKIFQNWSYLILPIPEKWLKSRITSTSRKINMFFDNFRKCLETRQKFQVENLRFWQSCLKILKKFWDIDIVKLYSKNVASSWFQTEIFEIFHFIIKFWKFSKSDLIIINFYNSGKVIRIKKKNAPKNYFYKSKSTCFSIIFENAEKGQTSQVENFGFWRSCLKILKKFWI